MSTERKIKNDQIEDIYPLTPMQEGLLYESLVQRDRDDQPYVIQSRYDINGDLQVEHFKDSWQKIVARHQVLRTAFAYEKVKKPVQVVLRNRPIPFKLIEIDKVPHESTNQIANQELKKGFDLQKDPLMRITLIRMEDGRYHMIWTHHHIIMDGWSLSIIERELFELYHAAISSRRDSLPPAIPVRNYINWLQSKGKNESVNFWSDFLKGFEKITPITIRKVTGIKGKKITRSKNFTLPDELREKLHDLARQSGVTLSTLMQTAWGILLSYYNNSDDVLFGSVVSGRPPHLSGSQEMVGVFINVLPIRLRFSPDKNLKDLITDMQSLFIDSQDYHDAPLAEVMSRIDRRELFDHLVTFENHPANTDGNADEMGISIQPYEAHDITHYPFGLKITDLKKIHLQYSWNTDLFHEERVDSIHSHYESLLYSIAEEPEKSVRTLSPLSDSERSDILQLSAGPKLSIDNVPDFLEMFIEQVQLNGESIACRDSVKSLTYNELNLRSNQLVQFLIQKNINPESRIAVEMDRNVDLVVSILAILKLNCSYVPIDPQLPEERKKELKSSANISFTIYQDILDLTSKTVLDDEFEHIKVSSTSEAYLIFTSGSTGKPKGVRISRSSLSHYIQTIKENIFQNDGGNMALLSSIAYDMTITTLFAPLAMGKTLFLFENHIPTHLALKKIFTPGMGIDTVKMTPSHIDLIESLQIKKTDVKQMIAGGEALLSRHVEAIHQISSKIKIINEYGPTETTVGSCFSVINDRSQNISIGKPMASTVHYVLDQHRRLLPIGCVGELYIGGNGLALGYLDHPDLTNEKFVHVDTIPGSPLLYQTGDIVRWNESGNLEYLGRKDQQLKIRGHRIEPGEIEAVIKENPLIKNAFVKAIGNKDETSLAAYYICTPNSITPNLKEQLLTFLQQKLPEAMVPQHLIQIEEVPLNSNGKVDYDQLPSIHEINEEDHNLEYWTNSFEPGHQNYPSIQIEESNSTDLLSDYERELLLNWNSTEKEFPEHSTLIDLFESIASSSAESTALLREIPGSDGQTQTMSYQELNDRANRLAHYLMEDHNITPETVVGICIERTPQMVVGLLGILKAGGAYLPLDPQYPAERLAYMIEDSGVNVVLTQEKILSELKVADAFLSDKQDRTIATVCLDSPGLFDNYSVENPSRQASPNELAYIIYTSGSTGKPKGVMIEHRGVVNWLLAYLEIMQITSKSRVLQVASLSFDASTHEIFSTLLAGAELFLIQKKDLINRHLTEFMHSHKITHIFLPPSLLAALPEHPLPHLKAITVGGEACNASLVDAWGKNHRLINAYGPTEITVCATFGVCEPGIGKPTIGKPVHNMQVHILDANNRLQPVGVPGELCISGVGLARGYINREELTREKFIHTEIFGRRIRLYRSGDLARWLDDGTIDFMGRIDDQVKLRGFRIEPGEIASTMMRHPDVTDAVVMVKKNEGDPRLVAYMIANQAVVAADFLPSKVQSVATSQVKTISSPQAEQLISEVHNLLTANLPDYMIPASITVIDSIPTTVSGKVDYNVLSKLSGTHRSIDSEKPENKLEKELLEIWSEVLNLREISVHDHFFRIGGHSLKAMQVVNRIGNKLKISVDLAELNEEPTIRGLAQRISKKKKGEGTQIPKANEQSDYPLSYAQQRLWLLHNMDAESAYNMPLTYKVGEPIDLSSLKNAFKDLIHRHEILRTAFILINGEPRQNIEEDAEIEITVKDYTNEENPITAARQFCEKQALIPFDLSQPPLLRCVLIKTGEEEYILQLCIHHIIGDGWSSRVLFNEMIALYESHKLGHENSLPENRVQYRDFTSWQLKKDFSEDRAFWLNYMEGASEKVYLPYDRSPAAKRKFIGRYIGTTLGKDIFSGLKKISSNKETTPSTVLLSLFALLLFKLTGQNDFPIAISSAGRNNRDLEQMIGFFVNILPLRVQINDQMDFDELLDTMIQSSGLVYAHQEYPFNKLVEDLNPDRAGAGQPLSNVVYGYQNYADVHLEGDSNTHSSLQKAEGFELQNNTAKFDITLFAFEKGSELQLDIEYDSDLFDEKTIQNYLDTLKAFAKMVASEYE